MDDFFSPEPNAADPTSDFLAREKAALGADATFGESNSGTPANEDFNGSAFPDLDGDDDTLLAPGGTARVEPVSAKSNSEFAAFENQFPEVEVSPPAQQNNGYGFTAPAPPSTFPGTPQPQEAESEAIKNWRVKQAEEIAKREAASAEKKEATIVKAQNDIDNFYKEYNAKKAKNIAKNKEDEAEFNALRMEALAKGTTWDRICDLVDLKDSRSKTNSKSTKDLSRFREVLLALRKSGDAPAAGGY